jgi:hypothetical protein
MLFVVAALGIPPSPQVTDAQISPLFWAGPRPAARSAS